MELHLSNATDGFLDTVFSSVNGLAAQDYNPWYGSVIGSIIVGLSGIIPLFIIPVDGSLDLKTGVAGDKLKLLLSFAVGGLLGDVFLHLLPQAWTNHSKNVTLKDIKDHPSMFCGLWVLAGLLVFIIVEKLFAKDKSLEEEIMKSKSNCTRETTNNNVAVTTKPENAKEISGYLNLMANVIDNFTHGLAVGGSFLLSLRVGVLTTLAILIHEVPHEVGDFAILMRAGFSRLEAAKAQLATASSSLVGACTAVAFSSTSQLIEQKTLWILPFTSGGFLHIALVTVLPELIEEKNPRESFKQISFLILGIAVMAGMTFVLDE
ncbi:zinc transporter ZIP13 homolog [Cimex lectularius]|uniref:Zinc transporter n=1 Tax=Cimex lectularius TaxID=79782 RepID=A0A8I6RAI3_CIMLE|nr:zinc transporter ZIP13 homolog [Cimex lectularius]